MTRVISEHEMYMGIADLVSHRSNDPNTQVGACIAKGDEVVSVGWNDFPNGHSGVSLPWDRKANCPLETKYPYVVHAELNAILKANKNDLVEASLYCTMPPCNECAKAIIQSGIKTVVYKGKWLDTIYHKASKILLTFGMSGITILEYSQLLSNKEIRIRWVMLKDNGNK